MPNWLGDLLMAFPFIKAVEENFSNVEIDIICKSNLSGLAAQFPFVNQVYSFSKETHGGLFGARKFVQENLSENKYDYFFTLPDSFSAAWMGRFVTADKKVGYAREARSFLLTKAYAIPAEMHRSSKYLNLLVKELGKKIQCNGQPFLARQQKSDCENVLLSFRSVAASRTLSLEKAEAICLKLAESSKETFVFTGTGSDIEYYNELLSRLSSQISGEKDQARFSSLAGMTNLPELLDLMQKAKAFLGVDSGTAHLANACGTPSVVLFGAGDEKETGGVFDTQQIQLRQKGLNCAPCLSNTCKFANNKCINELSTQYIAQQLLSFTR